MIDQALSFVRFRKSDAPVDAVFRALSGEVRYGSRRFPSVHRYYEAVRILECLQAGVGTARLIALAQRDWHVRGQNGCMFARLAALEAENLRWDTIVVEAAPAVIDMRICFDIERCVLDRIQDPQVQVLSIIFPRVSSVADAIRIMRLLSTNTSFWLERDEVAEGFLRLNIRYPVDDSTVQAWVMGFGPFPCIPNTRRGPYYELSLRMKEKPEKIFHRLNQDRNVAHLADAPLIMSERHWEHRWQSTLRRTRMILGGEPDEVSAARATLAVPLSEVSSTLCAWPERILSG